MQKTIAIVGAGFCGTVLAANLLRRPPPVAANVVLIERASEMGRGVAYAAREFPYLLNVPAARLSADSRDPLQFLSFARRFIPDADAEDFLPRQLYGDYLQEFLALAEQAAPTRVKLLRLSAEARHVTRGSTDAPSGTAPKLFRVEFDDLPPLEADRVILATGNPPPPLLPWAAAVRDHAAYRSDPWDLPEALSAEHSVLIVGNGLTMADAVFAMTRQAGGAPRMHTISRRGLLSLPQTAFHAAAMRGDGEELLGRAHSVRQVFAMTRALAREVEQRGGDWREVIPFIRQLAPTLWARLPAAEQRRFVRHLQAHWDVHRHRLPPQLAALIDSLRRDGRLSVNAGRIESVTAVGQRLRVTWRPRGSASATLLTVDWLVNATGPDYVLQRSADPLMNSLRAAGLISEDAQQLGLRTADYGACVDAQGRTADGLYYLGPMLRAAHWEATAATELRNRAELLAAHLIDSRTVAA
jgi:uncharacterized NAD(P)/FAD-binding protein YdhS